MEKMYEATLLSGVEQMQRLSGALERQCRMDVTLRSTRISATERTMHHVVPCHIHICRVMEAGESEGRSLYQAVLYLMPAVEFPQFSC